MQLTAGVIAAATDGVLVSGNAGRHITGFSIDTRTLVPGDLFFAIRGLRFDGHDFVADAWAAGASGVVVSAQAGPAPPIGQPVVMRVADTTHALQALARHVRRSSGAKVVAITGSAGKTTTKEIAAEFLSMRCRVFRNRGNLNNHIGLPLSLLELRDEPQAAVVELGMNHAGELSVLVAIAEPDVRVWLNVGDAHLGFFGSVDDLARAKAEILERAGPADVLIANADDTRVARYARAFSGRLVTFGFREGDIRAQEVEELGLDGMQARVKTPAGDFEIVTPLVGQGNLANVLAAIAVALQFDVPLAAIAERARTLKPAAQRGVVRRLPGGVTLIDDSYNASPSALANVLALVGRARGAARKVAFLGEMLELGEHAHALHDASGRLAASVGLSQLVTIGGTSARTFADAAIDAGMDPGSVTHVATSVEAAALVTSVVRPGDLVLVKASRGIAAERIVERLVAEFS